jgi:MFS superfamily sulfate permease-like transporter
MGVFWLVLSLTPLAARLMELTPESVIRGVQVTLGISLAWQGISLVANDSWLLGIATLVFILLASWGEAKRPTALVVVAGGLFLMWRSGTLPAWNGLQFALPSVQAPSVVEAWWGFWHAGLAQVPLTLTNAVMAVALLIKDYFPDRQVKERRLMLNTGLMNLGASFLGGFPICHGAGGLAGQYYYGARTGGANIMEGVIEVFLGAFMAGAILTLFQGFPLALVGAMMIVVGIELGKFSQRVSLEGLPVLVITVLAGLIWHMGVGFACGIAAAWFQQRFRNNTEEFAQGEGRSDG